MPAEYRFICDAMLGGLARWLRAAGYPACFDPAISDGALVRRAYEEDMVLVTSDSGVMERYAVAEGLVTSVFIPLGLSPIEQLRHLMEELDLQLRQPRCMECGAELCEVALERVEERVPEKVKRSCDRFFLCSGCDKVYWRGTHWEDIRRKLRRAAGGEERAE